MFCKNCGSTIPDGSAVCPFCSSPQEPAAPQQPAQPEYQQPQYQQPAQPDYQQNAYQQPAYQQPVAPAPQGKSEASTAKTLGIVAIITAFICTPLVAFICGGIGMSKANAVLAVNPADPEAQSAKKLNMIGIIIAAVVAVIGIIYSIVVNS